MARWGRLKAFWETGVQLRMLGVPCKVWVLGVSPIAELHSQCPVSTCSVSQRQGTTKARPRSSDVLKNIRKGIHTKMQTSLLPPCLPPSLHA